MTPFASSPEMSASPGSTFLFSTPVIADGGCPSDLGRVRINEVENGFDAGLIPSWFGQQMAELISKAWVLLGLLCP